MKIKTVDGNEACGLSSYLFTEVAGIYPITPSSPMAEYIDKEAIMEKLIYLVKKLKLLRCKVKQGLLGWFMVRLEMVV